MVIAQDGEDSVSSRMLATLRFNLHIGFIGVEVEMAQSRGELFEQIRRDRRVVRLSTREQVAVCDRAIIPAAHADHPIATNAAVGLIIRTGYPKSIAI